MMIKIEQSISKMNTYCDFRVQILLKNVKIPLLLYKDLLF